MTIKGLSLFVSASLASALSFAQPTFITELGAGETWVKTQYTRTNTEFDYDDSFGLDEKSNLNQFNANLITASEINSSFTPLMSFSINRLSENKENVIIKSAAVGGLFELDSSRQGALVLIYANSNKKEYVRDALGAQLSFEMSDKGNPIKNELSLTGSYVKKYQEISGGHSFLLANKSKFPFNQKLDLVINLGATFITDTKMKGFANTNYDPSFAYGGEINIHPSKSMTIQLSMANSSVDSNFGNENITQTNKLTSLSLIARF